MSAFDDSVAVSCASVAAGRAANEDRCWAEAFDPRSNLWGFRAVSLVADGMGGHERGELAAQMAVDCAREILAARPEDHEKFDAAFLGADTAGVVRRVFARANQRIWDCAVAEDLAGNMGTTLTLIVLDSEGAVVGHVGDSKAYVVSATGIEKVTEEHSWVGEMVREGAMTEEEAARSPLRSHLTQAVGASESVEPYIRLTPVKPGDILIVCSDGLTEIVSPDDIRDTVLAAESPPEACCRLVTAAADGGARDNVTAAMMVLPGTREAAPTPPSTEEEPAPTLSLFPELGPTEPAREAKPAALEGEASGPSSEPWRWLELAPAEGEPAVTVEAPAVEAPSSATAQPTRGEPLDKEAVAAGELRRVGSVSFERVALLGSVCVMALVAGLFAGKRLVRPQPQPATALTQGMVNPEPVRPSEAPSPEGAAPTGPGASASPGGVATPGAAQGSGAFVLEASLQSGSLVVRSSEPVAYQVYTRSTNRDLLPEQGAAEEERFPLPAKPPADWGGATVRLQIERLGGGRIRITPTPADLRVFVDKTPYEGAALQDVKAKGQHARIGFYFPPGVEDRGYGIAIADFLVETEQPSEGDVGGPATEAAPGR